MPSLIVWRQEPWITWFLILAPRFYCSVSLGVIWCWSASVSTLKPDIKDQWLSSGAFLTAGCCAEHPALFAAWSCHWESWLKEEFTLAHSSRDTVPLGGATQDFGDSIMGMPAHLSMSLIHWTHSIFFFPPFYSVCPSTCGATHIQGGIPFSGNSFWKDPHNHAQSYRPCGIINPVKPAMYINHHGAHPWVWNKMRQMWMSDINESLAFIMSSYGLISNSSVPIDMIKRCLWVTQDLS